jgi:hypothetical protein
MYGGQGKADGNAGTVADGPVKPATSISITLSTKDAALTRARRRAARGREA